MKSLLAAALCLAAVGLSACDGPVLNGLASADGPYALEILARDGDEALHYARNTETGTAAALATVHDRRDRARLLEGRAAERARARMLAELDTDREIEPSDFQLRMFGVDIAAGDDATGEEHFRMNVTGPGGTERVSINAGDGGVAHIVIRGVDANGLADFIDDIDDAPRDLREEMKASLGL